MKFVTCVFVLMTLPVLASATTSKDAAFATAETNALCTLIQPFYWEIGDAKGTLISESVGVQSNAQPILSTTKMSVASASKMVYAAYVVQLRGSAAALYHEDVNFLHFTSGYTNMQSSTTNTCPSALNPDTINQCLTLTNTEGQSYGAQDPANVGIFAYSGAQMENHASKFTDLGDLDTDSLSTRLQDVLGSGITMKFSEPLPSGGISATPQEYALFLQLVVSGTLAMHDALGIDPVCTKKSKTCESSGSPIPEEWHYSIGHWVEDDPSTNGDGAFSSPGEFGFYPWIGPKKKSYGLIAREQETSDNGYASAQCGRLIRHAWLTGVVQTGPLPTAEVN